MKKNREKERVIVKKKEYNRRRAEDSGNNTDPAEEGAQDVRERAPGKEQSQEKIRLNKYLGMAGVCSRREADRLIDEGRVLLNGAAARPGDKVAKEDTVLVDGKEVHLSEPEILLLFHKPPGIVCSTRKQRDETTVMEFLNYPVRVYPVGRLDKDSEGLLLLTNQGDLMNRILKAGNGHEKEYIVTLDRPFEEGFLEAMEKGVPILDTVTRPCRTYRIARNRFGIILTQGLNRQIRRMCEYFGYRVIRLKRIRVLNLTLKDLPSGKYREATGKELLELKEKLYPEDR